MSPTPATRGDAYTALMDLSRAAASAASDLAHTDYDLVVGYCEETRERISEWDRSAPRCLDCDTPVRPPADRCLTHQAQHDEGEAMPAGEAWPERPHDL